MRLRLLIALSTFVIIWPGYANASSDYMYLKTKSDWDKLFQACESSWSKYEADLARLRSTLKREINSMSQEQYEKKYYKDDEKIRFIRVHWPSDFSSKDSGWAMYKDCAGLNWEARKLLNSPSSDKKDKEKVIKGFERCLQKTFYGRSEKIGHPFDRLLACYRKH